MATSVSYHLLIFVLELHILRQMMSRSRISITFLLSMFLLCILIPSEYCSAIDAITQTQGLSREQTLISSSQIFEFGFFSPGNSGKQYVGIWYKNISVPTIVWIANRERPLSALDNSATLAIGSDGNLRLVDGMQNTVWSTNLSAISNNSMAVLLDDGDFVLKDSISGEFLWESFNSPCDTLLPRMKIGMNIKTGKRHFLASWQTKDDPSPGKFAVGIAAQIPLQSFIWSGTIPYWRSGQWNGLKFTGVPAMEASYMNVFSLLQDTEQGTLYFTLNVFNSSVRNMMISSVGSLKIRDWDEDKKEWSTNWEAPGNPCDLYGACGPYGVCNKNKSPICRCLKGFVAKSRDQWNKGNWTDGCIRRTELLCNKEASVRRKSDGFWKLSAMKLPDLSEYLRHQDAKGCEIWCLNNCSCMAYAYVTGIGCVVWSDLLVDIEEFSFSGEDLFLRLASTELGENRQNVKLISSFITVSVFIFLAASVYSLLKWNANKRGKIRRGTHEDLWKNHAKQRESSELPMLDFDKIVVATNNFSQTNKLGKGGFGPVFKGKLKDGQEIAVKRLSSSSGQGIEEFKNEIALISKLQHRNLVRLLGCCIEGEEKLLIYEFMPNKSLDTFLFDTTKRLQLDWAKRFNIIQGISRGLLYLHRDSCLRIIHRDLKVSNILLDEDMNPKISDFGLARTFKRTQDLANTHRVVGTFGYMSPEYAMGGVFSEKSDVFSFGVLLMEIVSSKKNTSFHYDDQHLSLLVYAWQLWNEGKGLDLIDRALTDSFSALEVMRCIHVGLLCVQDHAADRPSMADVVLMLSSETDRPQPKQPIFSFQRARNFELQSRCNNACSINEATMSTVVGR